MKKIIYLFTLLSVFLLILGLSPSIKVRASTVWNNDYVFDAINTTHNGVSLSIEEGANIFTIHGTSIAQNDNYNFPNMLVPNSNGSVLDVSKSYYAYYEYISGTVSATSWQFSPFEVTNINQYNRFIHLAPDHALSEHQNYRMNKGFVFTHNGSGTHLYRITFGFDGTVYNQFKYRLTIKEINPETRSINMFSTMSPFENRGLTYSFANPNTIVLNGTVSAGTNLNLLSKMSSNVSEPTKPVLIYVKKTSGSTDDLTWGFSFNTRQVTTPGNAPLLSYSTTLTSFGIILDEIENFYLVPNVPGKVYNNLTFEFFVQEIDIYLNENPEDPEPEDPIPGETTTPPTGFYLGGSYWFGQIYYNAAEDLPQGSYYVATTEGSTFDFDILFQEQVTFGMDAGVKFRVYYDNGQSYDEFDGPGDITISRIENVVNVKLTIDDDTIDQYNYTIGGITEVSAFVVIVPVGEPVTEVEVSFFDDDGMTLLDSAIYEPGDLITAPTDPVKSGFIFVGWETEDNVLWNFATDTIGTNPLDLYALFIEEDAQTFTVTFISNGGSTVNPSIVYEHAPVMLPVPTRTGYNFVGWYLDEELTLLFAANTPIIEDLTLYAKWTPTTSGGGTVTPPPAESQTSSTYIIIGVITAILILGLLSSKKKG